MQFIETAYAETEAQVATETTQEADAGVLASLGLNGTLFVAQFINFALVVCVLWFLILKPLTKKLSERQKMIDESIENSKKVEENLAKSEQKFQERIDEAKVEANKIVEKAVLEAEQTTGAMKAKAKQEIEALVEQAKKNIKAEREEMKQEIKKDTAELITLALEKILTEKMTDKKDKELITEMLKKMK